MDLACRRLLNSQASPVGGSATSKHFPRAARQLGRIQTIRPQGECLSARGEGSVKSLHQRCSQAAQADRLAGELLRGGNRHDPSIRPPQRRGRANHEPIGLLLSGLEGVIAQSQQHLQPHVVVPKRRQHRPLSPPVQDRRGCSDYQVTTDSKPIRAQATSTRTRS